HLLREPTLPTSVSRAPSARLKKCMRKWKGPGPRSDRCDNSGCTNPDIENLPHLWQPCGA
ncbi:hypothetical protein M9458_016484, partial [Cirrhinus mrigala]